MILKVIFFTNTFSSRKLVDVLNNRVTGISFPTKPDLNFLDESDRKFIHNQVYRQLHDNELKTNYINSQKTCLKHDSQTLKIGINIEFD